MRVEVRATGVRTMRLKRGLTQRRVARDVVLADADIAAIEANDRQAGPNLQQQLVRYFGCAFSDLFDVILIDPETGTEQVLKAREALRS